MTKIWKILLPSLLILWSCKKDPPTIEPVNSGTLEFNVTNVAGNQLLALNTQTFINQSDTFTVTKFKYYISNIRLFLEDNFTYIEQESYHLLDQEDTSSCKFVLKNIPYGNYTRIEFIIGVDSLRNCSGAQTGALDPANGMFWTWSQGYIFAKMEGICPTAPGGGFIYHIGGFTGIYSAIVKATPSFGNKSLQVSSGHASKMYLKADILEWFKTPNSINFTQYPSIAGGKPAKEIAANYSDMFTIAAITN